MCKTILLIGMIISLSACATTHKHAVSSGIIEVQSQHSFEQTLARLQQVIEKKGLRLFAVVNHSENADKVGLSLEPTALVVFGNPKIGTPLMQCASSVGLDLPQKMLIREEAQGQVTLSYNSMAFLSQRHDLAGCQAVVDKVEMALANLSRYAVGQ